MDKSQSVFAYTPLCWFVLGGIVLFVIMCDSIIINMKGLKVPAFRNVGKSI